MAAVKIRLPKPRVACGYTREEIIKICQKRNIGEERFWHVFGTNTARIYRGKVRYYRCDIERALAQILGYRRVSIAEWD